MLSCPEVAEGDEGGEVSALEEPRARADDEAVGGDREGALLARRRSVVHKLQVSKRFELGKGRGCADAIIAANICQLHRTGTHLRARKNLEFHGPTVRAPPQVRTAAVH